MKRLLPVLLALLLLAAPGLSAAETRLRLATTTSTENTGLLYELLPPFEKAAGVKVDVIAVGTGKALTLARNCDADAVLVHAKSLEEEFVAQGYGIERTLIMHNYFLVVGPAADPAGVAQAESAPQALARIARAKAPFVSRGDNSGTNVRELALLKKAGIKPGWPGYLEAGQGMGAVLTMAGQKQAYTLSDSGTFYKYLASGKLDLKPLYGTGEELKNVYHLILVNPDKCPGAAIKAARALRDYLVSPSAQGIIGGFRADGRQLFWPDAAPGRP